MRNVTLILGCSIVLILSNGKWNELTRHLKDHGKDSSNLGRILSNLGRMM
jgi:ribosomal protein S15P/S13E